MPNKISIDLKDGFAGKGVVAGQTATRLGDNTLCFKEDQAMLLELATPRSNFKRLGMTRGPWTLLCRKPQKCARCSGMLPNLWFLPRPRVGAEQGT